MGYSRVFPLIFNTAMEKKIMHLEVKTDRILVFGGVYSNLQALQELKSIAEAEGIAPEHCICTGDIVGYCAQPEETVQLFREWGALSISGNVEQQLADGSDDCGCDFTEGSRCDVFSRTWFPFSKEQLSKDAIEWMEKLPEHLQFTFAGKKITVVHGSYEQVSDFIFESTSVDKKQVSFSASQSDVIIGGHCGLPFHHAFDNKLWLNPGVIGMPANDGTPRVWYMLLEEVEGKLKYTHRSFEYDYHTAKQLMHINFLPEAYADTLQTGLWDNMEILPELEKMAQGIPIDFNTNSKTNKNTKQNTMANNYYDPADLRKFGKITEWSEELGTKFFDYYGKVFEEGALTAREKSLIALAVSHVVKCPYCIDAYTKDGLQKGITKEEMMEAVHVGAAIESGATLVHGVQMMNKYNKLSH